MHYYIFVFLYVASISYMLFKKRNVDFFTLMVASLSYYSFPLLVGEVNLLNVIEHMEIHKNIYFVFIFSYVVNFVFMFFSDCRDKKSLPLVFNHSRSYYLYILFLIAVSTFSIGVYLFGFSAYFLETKSNKAELNAFLSISIWAALSLFVLSFHSYRKNTLGIAISSFIVLSYMLYGARSYAVILFIIFFLLLFDFRKTYLFKKVVYAIFGAVVVAFFVVFKVVYKEIKDLNIHKIPEIISGMKFDIIYNLLFVDPLSVIYNFNLVIENNIALPIEYFYHRLFSAVPLGSSLYSSLMKEEYIRFSNILHNDYHTVHWGLASSFWGEALALSNYLGLCAIIFFWIFLLYRYNKLAKKKNSVLLCVIFPAVVYSTFYIHRLDITFVLGAFKSTLIIFAFAYLTRKIIKLN